MEILNLVFDHIPKLKHFTSMSAKVQGPKEHRSVITSGCLDLDEVPLYTV